MKLHEPKKNRDKIRAKKGRNKKPNRKRRKCNKMLSQKVKRSGEFFLTKGNKRKERTQDQVLTHELLASTLSYLMPAPW
jgi:hypothetical protein